MKTVQQVLEGAVPGAVSFEEIMEETGLGEEEVKERLSRLAQRGDVMEVKPGKWMSLM